MEALRSDDPVQIGPFELVGRLGVGGMGQVYLGRTPGGEFAAVKVVHAGYTDDPDFRARFAREVALVVGVRASWAVAVVGADPEAARPWLATEYVPGPSLAQAVTAGGALPERSLGFLAGRLSVALAELHALGVVHRDLKPSNVLLAADGPKLIDFGVARAVDATRITQTGMVVGTPAFMSPEQAVGEEEGYPSDVFSLAGVLVFAACGQGPFGATANAPAMLYRIIHDEPDLARVPGWLRDELAPCLAKDPAGRPVARELADRLVSRMDAPDAWPPPSLQDPPAHQSVLLSGPEPSPRRTPTKLFRPVQPVSPPPSLPQSPAVSRPRWRPWVVVAVIALVVGAAGVVWLWQSPHAEGPRQLPAPRALPMEAPNDMCVTPDGSRVLVLDDREGVKVVDTTTNWVIHEVHRLRFSELVACPLGGSRAYVAGDLLQTIDLRADRPVADAINQTGESVRIDTPSDAFAFEFAWSLVASRNGDRLLWASLADGPSTRLLVVDLPSLTVRNVASFPNEFARALISPDGDDGYILHHTKSARGTIESINLTTGARVPIDTHLPLAIDPHRTEIFIDGLLSLSADGRLLYAQCFDGVAVIDTRMDAVVDLIKVPAGSLLAVPSASRRYLFMSADTTLKVFEVAGKHEVARVSIPTRTPSDTLPHKIALSPDGRHLYMLYSQTLYTFDVSEFI